MKNIARVALFAVALSHVAANALTASDPLALLDTMSRNFRVLNYRGVFTYEQGQQLSSVQIAHAVVDGKERERIAHLDGDAREFLRHDHPVNCIHAGNQLLRLSIDGASQLLSLSDSDSTIKLSDYYDIGLDGDERVAGRVGSRLRITPRDPYRYGMTLVLDKETALLLKAETADAAGRVLERFQFVSVTIGGEVPGADLLARGANPQIAASHADDAGGALVAAAEPPFDWAVAWLPQGFRLAARESRQTLAPGQAVQVQIYTDGLAVFSVFVEPEDQAASQKKAGHASQGATVAYMAARGKLHVVTVVGEIPIATAQLVANAVNFPIAGS